MKIFECSNTSHEMSGDYHDNFKTEIKKRFDPKNNKFHYKLSDLLSLIPEKGKKVREQLGDFKEVLRLSNRANNLLDSSWKERHSDNYRTETYTDTESYT
ncbi:hypothetical protein GOV12_08095, partial [Candidatus Pacearchaeota archaeon]|nr:hypothetical protein [Candidatus Pacearchaeota archaeon]